MVNLNFKFTYSNNNITQNLCLSHSPASTERRSDKRRPLAISEHLEKTTKNRLFSTLEIFWA